MESKREGGAGETAVAHSGQSLHQCGVCENVFKYAPEMSFV